MYWLTTIEFSTSKLATYRSNAINIAANCKWWQQKHIVEIRDLQVFTETTITNQDWNRQFMFCGALLFLNNNRLIQEQLTKSKETFWNHNMYGKTGKNFTHYIHKQRWFILCQDACYKTSESATRMSNDLTCRMMSNDITCTMMNDDLEILSQSSISCHAKLHANWSTLIEIAEKKTTSMI
jgi:hypothetical protein